MSKNSILFKNTIIIAIGKLFSQFLSFLLLPIYSFYLTPKELGSLDLILSYLTLIIPVILLQLDMAAFRFLIESRKDREQQKIIISNILKILLATTLIASIIFTIVGIIIKIPYFWYIYVIAITNITSSFLLQLSRGLGFNSLFSIASILSGLALFLSSIFFILVKDQKINGALLALIIANITCTLFLVFKLKESITLKFSNKNLRSQLIRYSTPLIPNGISWWIINISDRTIISTFLGLSANGIYSISNKYVAIFPSIFQIFITTWTESISLNINKKNNEQFISKIINIYVRIFGSLGLLLIAFNPYVFTFFIGKNFQNAYYYVPILTLAAFFHSIIGLYSGIYIAKKLTKTVMITSLYAALINLILTLGLTRYIGIYGASIATLVAYFSMAIYRYYGLKKYIKINYDKNLFIKLIFFYILAITISYINDFTGNLINLFLILFITIMLNKKIATSSINELLNLIKK